MQYTLGALGGGILGAYKYLPFYVRFPLAVGMTVFAVSETQTHLQQAIQAPAISGGAGAEGAAKLANLPEARLALTTGGALSNASALITTQINQQDALAIKTTAEIPGITAESTAKAASAPATRQALENGGEISNATALVGTQINQQDTTARRTSAEIPGVAAGSAAAAKSIAQIQDELARGLPVTAAESMRLVEWETKMAERDTARAQAKVNANIAQLWSPETNYPAPTNSPPSYAPPVRQPNRAQQPYYAMPSQPVQQPYYAKPPISSTMRAITRWQNDNDIGALIGALGR